MGLNTARAQRTAITVGNRALDLFTRHGATLTQLGQACAGFEDQLLGGARRRTESKRYVLVRKPIQLAHEQRTALPFGQRTKVRDQGPHTGPLARLLLGRDGRWSQRL
jgi:hypothetical protein